MAWCVFFFQAEDGIRDLVRSRGLGDVYKRQNLYHLNAEEMPEDPDWTKNPQIDKMIRPRGVIRSCLLYTSDAADERSSVDLGGRRIIKKTTRCACAQASTRITITEQQNKYKK